MEISVKTMSLREITPSDMTPDIYPSMRDRKYKIIHEQKPHVQFVDIALQTSDWP